MTALPLKNFFVLVGAEVFSKIVTFAAFAYLARLLGAASFGYIEWAAAVLLCASLIVDQGFSLYGAREIAKNPARTAQLMMKIVTARLVMAAIAYSLVVLFALIFVKERQISLLILIYSLSLWGLPFLLQWVFQGHEQMNVVSRMQIVRQTVFAGIVFAFVRSAEDLLIVGIAEVCAVFSAVLFGIWMFRRNFDFPEKFRPQVSREVFREGAPIGLSQIFWTVKMFGATLILGLFATAEETGLFAAAMRIFIAVHVFVWFYYFNLLPALTRAWHETAENFKKLIGDSMKIVLPFSIFGGISWVLLASLIMKSLYGQEFTDGATALQWLGGAWVMTAVSGHFRFGLIASGFQRKELLTSAIGASLVFLFLPVGYSFFGISGAAAALFAAETGILFSSWIFARQSFSDAQLLSPNNLEPLSGTIR